VDSRLKRKKYAFFYTIHDALDEFNLNKQFFNRSKFLCDNFDIIVNCNCPEQAEGAKVIMSRFDSKRLKVLHLDPVNEGKHLMGPPEQIAHSFNGLLPYELVFHLHADVYVVSDHGLKKVIQDWEDPAKKRHDFYVFPLPQRDSQYAFDAWLFSPSEKTNVFKDWQTYEPRGKGAEPYLYDVIHDNNLSAGLFDRGPHAGMYEEYEPNSGLLDTTNFNTACGVCDHKEHTENWNDFIESHEKIKD